MRPRHEAAQPEAGFAVMHTHRTPDVALWDQYRALREQWTHEDTLVGQRITWLILAEGLLLNAYVSLGDPDKGIALIQKGIAKGNLKHPEDGKLRLGMAQLQSAKTRAAGLQTLRSVKGNDGVAEIARLWTIVQGG